MAMNILIPPPDNPAALVMYAIGMQGYAALLIVPPFLYFLWRRSKKDNKAIEK
jgi:hypothetical protein